MAKASGQKDYSEFVREFVTDPANVPDVMCLYGYLGKSTEDGHERLYQTPSLTPYIEIPTNAILHRRKAAHEHDPLDGVMLWVRRDAKLIYKMTPTAQAQASYFAGALQANAAARAPNVPGLMLAPHHVGRAFGASHMVGCPPVHHHQWTPHLNCHLTESDCVTPGGATTDNSPCTVPVPCQ